MLDGGRHASTGVRGGVPLSERGHEAALGSSRSPLLALASAGVKLGLGLILRHLPCSVQSADLKIHTVHVEDACAAALLAAEWMSKVGREKADKEVGVDLGFSGVDKESLGDMEGSCKPSLCVSLSTHFLCLRGLPWLIPRSRLPE